MDRETRDQYVLVIQAKDMVGQMGGLSGTTSVTVTLTDVNDNPPRFTHSKTPFLIVPTGSIKLMYSRYMPCQQLLSNLNKTCCSLSHSHVFFYRLNETFKIYYCWKINLKSRNRMMA